MVEANIILAFGAGLLAFISPCVLPIIPAFLAYLAGTTVSAGGSNAENRVKIFVNTVFFVLGFSVVFAIIGVLLEGVLSFASYDVRVWLGRIGGVVIIGFGLYLLGLLNLPFLDQEHKLKAHKTRYQYLTSFIFGATFAAGWTPCVGALLGAILTLAVTQPLQAFPLLLSFSLGITFPFLLTGLFYSQAAKVIARAGKVLVYFKIASGIILIILGVMVFTGNLGLIANYSSLSTWIDKLNLTR